MKRLLRLEPRDWIGLALLVVGFVLRLRQYLVNRSLWLDEAMLTNNILSRSFVGLTRPLSNDQGAPLGFLFLQKTITLLLGDSEYTLRLFPLTAALISLALMFVLARRLSSPFAGSLALTLFALSPALIYYASEVKQYSSDVALSLALLLFYLKYERAEIRTKDAVLLSLTGILAIWFSHPALFILAGIGLALFVPALRAGDSRKAISLLLVAAFWALSLGALYFINLRDLASHQFFLDFWREGFLPHALPDAFTWLAFSLYVPFFDLLGLQAPYIFTVFLFLIGFVGLTKRHPRFGLSLALILLLALFASFLSLYPFAGRMILFLTPAFVLLLAEGVEFIAGLFKRPTWFAWLIRLSLVGLLLFGPLKLAAEDFTAPKTREHIRPALEYLRDFRKPGDVIYLYHWAEHAVRYYAPRVGFASTDFMVGADHHASPEAYLPELDSLRGHARVWFLFTHVYQSGGFNERDYILSYLDSIGELSREVRLPGTTVYLYLYDLK